MGASVIAHGNSSPVLDFAKHVLNFMALPIKLLVMHNLMHNSPFSIFPGWNAWRDSLFNQFAAKPIGIIAFACQEFISFRHYIKQCCCTLVIACLAFGKMKSYRLPKGIADRMKF